MDLILLTSALALCTQTIRSQLLSSPMNKIVSTGQRVELECSTNATAPLMWRFKGVNSTQFEFIYLNGQITHEFSSRYKVNTSINGRWTLVIDSVAVAHAGTYRCENTETYDPQAIAMKVSAELIVIDSDPVCGTNASNGGIVDGDYIQMWCKFNNPENCIPVMEFVVNNGLTVDADTNHNYESRKVTASLLKQLTSRDNGIVFTCKMSLISNATNNRPVNLDDTKATNIPYFQCPWKFTANVLYGPRNLTIEPIGDLLELGDRLICSADGNPTPTFKWTEAGTNRVTDGPILFIDKAVALKQKFAIKCTASNWLADQNESISVNVTFSITASCKPGIIVFAVPAIVTVIGILALVLGVTLTVRAVSKDKMVNHERCHESSDQPRDYEMVDESNMKSVSFGRPPLNKTTAKKQGTKPRSAKTTACEDYSDLKRRSSATPPQPAVYAELQQYANNE